LPDVLLLSVFSDCISFPFFIEYKKKVLQYQEDIDQLEGFQTQEMAKIKHLVGKLFEFYFPVVNLIPTFAPQSVCILLIHFIAVTCTLDKFGALKIPQFAYSSLFLFYCTICNL
jgi:hypothetical protein